MWAAIVFTLTVIGVIYAVITYHWPKAPSSERFARNDHKRLVLTGLTTGRFAFSKRRRLGRSLQRIIHSHLYHATQRVDVGTHEEVKLQFYVDLMEAAVLAKELRIMSAALSIFLRDVIQYPYEIIAVPKNGNPLLGFAVARHLKKKLLIIKDSSPRRTYKLDGTFNVGDTAVLIDDVSSDGEFLARPLGILRHYRITVHDCGTIVHRTEGPAAVRLRELDCNFHAMLSLSDHDIEGLLGLKPLPI
jgi:orotate phosphoribosyltransferase